MFCLWGGASIFTGVLSVKPLGSHEVDQWGFVLYISVETKPSTRSTGSEREAERGEWRACADRPKEEQPEW
jgi:hypothetical protein